MRVLEVALVDLVVLQISKLIDTERMRRLQICTCVLFGVIRSVVLQNLLQVGSKNFLPLGMFGGSVVNFVEVLQKLVKGVGVVELVRTGRNGGRRSVEKQKAESDGGARRHGSVLNASEQKKMARATRANRRNDERRNHVRERTQVTYVR